MICASEQSVIVLESIYESVKAEFLARGCYFLNPIETEKIITVFVISVVLILLVGIGIYWIVKRKK